MMVFNRLKEQFPDLFNDLCLYSEVCAILSNYSFHLPARKFIQELFQETKFDEVRQVNIYLVVKRPGCKSAAMFIPQFVCVSELLVFIPPPPPALFVVLQTAPCSRFCYFLAEIQILSL